MGIFNSLSTVLYRIMFLSVIMLWLWMMVGFQADPATVTFYHAAILAGGLIAAAIMIFANEFTYVAMIGGSYILLLGFALGGVAHRLDGGAMQTVIADLTGEETQITRLSINRETRDAQSLLETVMADLADPSDSEDSASVNGSRQIVSRSNFLSLASSGF